MLSGTPRRVVCLSPHPDDAVLAAGGLIQRLEMLTPSPSHFISVVVATKGYADDAVNTEDAEATRCLVSTAVDFVSLDGHVRELFMEASSIREHFASINRSVQPDLVICPCSGDTHQDHEVVHREAVRVFRNSTVLGYDCPWNGPQPRQLYVGFGEAELKKKIAVLGIFKSQSHRRYMHPDAIRASAMAKAVEGRVAAPFAESFEVIRAFW